MKYLFKLLPLFVFSSMAFANTSTLGINTCQDLQNIGQNLSAHFVLNQDIDCEGFQWIPIAGTFRGTLDGQNHIISNLMLQKNINGSDRADWHYIGMFTEMQRAVVKNLQIKNSRLSVVTMNPAKISKTDTARIVKQIKSAMFQKSNPPTNAVVGGIIGVIAESSTFENIVVQNANVSLDTLGTFGFVVGAAKNSQFNNVQIVEGLIDSGSGSKIHVPIALHAFAAGYLLNTEKNEGDIMILIPTNLAQ